MGWMLALLLMMDAVAGDLEREVALKYTFVTATDATAQLTLAADGAPSGLPKGVTVRWVSTGGDLDVVVDNRSAEVVEVNWDRSAFVSADRSSSGLVPGSTRRGDVGVAVPPSVIPPGGVLQEPIVRKTAVDKFQVGHLVGLADAGGKVSVTLALQSGAGVRYLSQTFTVGVNWVQLDLIEAAGAQAVAAQAIADEEMRASQEATRVRVAAIHTNAMAAASARYAAHAKWAAQQEPLQVEYDKQSTIATLFGVGGVGSALFFGAVVPIAVLSDPDFGVMDPNDWALTEGLAAASLAVGLPVGLIAWKKARASKAALVALGPEPAIE